MNWHGDHDIQEYPAQYGIFTKGHLGRIPLTCGLRAELLALPKGIFCLTARQCLKRERGLVGLTQKKAAEDCLPCDILIV